MSATNYSACLAKTLQYEGGYSNDPGDPGGPTKYGITIADVRRYLNPNATAETVKALTLDQAKAIYRKHYWEPVAGDQLPDGIDLATFDGGVNSGISRGVKWLAQGLKADSSNVVALAILAKNTADKVAVIKRMCALRLSFLQNLSTWRLFGRGWGSRVASVEATGVKMALAATGMPKPQVAKELQKEADKATLKRNQQGAGTAAAGGAAAPAHEHFLNMGTAGKVIIAAIIVAVLVFIVWHIWQNHQRAAAYKEAATGA